MTSLNISIFDKKGRVRSFAAMKKEIFEKVMNHYEGNMSDAADALQIGRSTLYRLKKKKK